MSSPLDDDEDLTPIRKPQPLRPGVGPAAGPPAGPPAGLGPAPGAGPAQRAPAAGPVPRPALPEPADEAVGFGLVGSNSVGDFADHSGRRGVIRHPGPGVRYDPLPAGVAELHPVWADPQKRGERFELLLDGLDTANGKSLLTGVTTLQKLGQGLVERWPERGVPEDLDRADRLDQAADALLTLVAALHRGNWRVGLLQPETVFILPSETPGGKARVILPDLGFAWQSKQGQPPWDGTLGKPRWLDDDHRSAPLWPQRPVWQQFAREWHRTPDGSAAHQASPDSAGGLPEPLRKQDLQTVARVLASTLTGEAAKEVKSPAGKAAPVWGVLTRAANGEFATADAFRSALQNARLSEHYLGARPKNEPELASDQRPKSSAGLFVGIGVLILAVLGAAALIYLYVGRPTDTTSVAVNPTGLEPTKPQGTKTENGSPISTKKGVVDPPIDVSMPPRTPLSPSSALAKLKEGIEKDPAMVTPTDFAELGKLLEGFYQRDDLSDAEKEWRVYLRGQYVGQARVRIGNLLDESALLGKKKAVREGLEPVARVLNRLSQDYPPPIASLQSDEKACLARSKPRLKALYGVDIDQIDK